jgi:hypothetical protein
VRLFHRRALTDLDNGVPERVPAGMLGPPEEAVGAVATGRRNSARSSPTAPSLPPFLSRRHGTSSPRSAPPRSKEAYGGTAIRLSSTTSGR